MVTPGSKPAERNRNPRRRPWLRRFGAAAGALGAVLALTSAVLLWLAWSNLGRAPKPAELTRVTGTERWRDGKFQNPLPLYNDTRRMLGAIFDGSPYATPTEPVPVVRPERSGFEVAPKSGLRVTWFGHSSLLIELDGRRLLTDPVWSRRASPLGFVGPARWYAPLLELSALPKLDAVLISHDHYDHLDAETIRSMRDWETRFIVPLGVGSHLEYWGIARERISELAWGQETNVAELRVVCTQARHASGRHPLAFDATLWAGFALIGPRHRVYFSGDTGLFPELEALGREHGPFDVTLIEVGAYNAAWPDWHLGPEQAVRAHQMLRGKALIPVHWGLFDLALHGWTEPIERTLVAAAEHGVRVLTPRPGQSLEPTEVTTERWWPPLPWQSASEHPIRATGF